MIEDFIDWDPSDSSLQRLKDIKLVLNSFKTMGIRLTLRQLFYQLVSRNIIANTQREYKNLGNLLSKARLAGFIDWDIIEDRVRQAERPPHWDSIQDLAEAAGEQFRLDRWKEQEFHVELWCEKDALSSVLEPICNAHHVTFMVNRGYSSTSAMYESSKRISKESDGRAAIILYLGDFDPSGEDMVRDVRERLELFRVDNLEVQKLALTPEQVKSYNLPPNPLKRDAVGALTDSRGRGFQAEHGNSSYEVDALPPDVLQELVKRSIRALMNVKDYNAVLALEDGLRKKLAKAVKGIK